MRIVCPQCEFARDVPDEKVPARSNTATCPKCGLKFKFRDLPGHGPDETESAASGPDRESGEPGDSGRSSEAGGQEKRQASNEEPRDREFWDRIDDIRKPRRDEESDVQPRRRRKPILDEFDLEPAPWENRGRHGFVRGFWDTVRLACVAPVTFFSGLKIGGLRDPFLFGLIITEIVVLTSLGWDLLFSSLGFTVLGMHNPALQQPDPGMNFISGVAGGLIRIAVSIIVVIPLYTIGIFLQAVMLHIFLALFRGADRGFAGSFAAVTYSSAPMILTVVPVVGQIIGPVWSLVILAVAFKYIHRTTYMKITIAWTLPFLILLILALVGFYTLIDKAPPGLF